MSKLTKPVSQASEQPDFVNFEFTAENNRSQLLGEGEYIVEIESIAEEKAQRGKVFEDETPQLKVVLRHASKKMLTWWMNLIGYLRFEELTEEHLKGIAPQQVGVEPAKWNKMSTDQRIAAAFDAESQYGENYAVSRITKHRVKSPERTKAALGIINTALLNAGVAEGTKIKGIADVITQLQGSNIGIHVEKSSFGMMKVLYSMPPDRVEELVD